MASKAEYYKNSSLSLQQQKVRLCWAYKHTSCNIDRKKNELSWYGKIRPTALSKEYTIKLTYHPGMGPKVWVIGDELEKLDDINFPHKFSIDTKNKRVEICLCRHWEFHSSKSLADTIIPWTVEWLYFYELWLVTGKWLGGGDHPSIGNSKTKRANTVDDILHNQAM